MKLKQDKLTAGLNDLHPESKNWLLLKGYIVKNTEFAEAEYRWTEEGHRWANGFRQPKEGE